jgi:hypothetical protein
MARPSTLFRVALEHGTPARPQQKKLEADTRREAGINQWSGPSASAMQTMKPPRGPGEVQGGCQWDACDQP